MTSTFLLTQKGEYTYTAFGLCLIMQKSSSVTSWSCISIDMIDMVKVYHCTFKITKIREQKIIILRSTLSLIFSRDCIYCWKNIFLKKLINLIALSLLIPLTVTIKNKRAKISPIFKHSVPKNPSNYTGQSFSSIQSFEKVVKVKLVKCLKNKQMLSYH